MVAANGVDFGVAGWVSGLVMNNFIEFLICIAMVLSFKKLTGRQIEEFRKIYPMIRCSVGRPVTPVWQKTPSSSAVGSKQFDENCLVVFACALIVI